MNGKIFEFDDKFFLKTTSGFMKKNMEVQNESGEKFRIRGYKKQDGEILFWVENEDGRMLTLAPEDIADDLRDLIKILERL